MSTLVRDILSAGRVANLPTVWSNILCGSILTAHALERSYSGDVWERLLITLLSGSLLYLGGCFYNDYHDRDWDAEHKPTRALPAGRVKPSLLLAFTLSCFFIGLALASYLGIVATVSAVMICFFIWLYTLIHKKTPLGTIPMGLCRAGLYFQSITIIKDTPLLTAETFIPSLLKEGGLNHLLLPAVTLLLFIAGLTLVARTESKGKVTKEVKALGLILVSFPLSSYLMSVIIVQDTASVSGVIACGIFTVLLVAAYKHLSQKKIGAFVSLCLAMICLVDLVLVFTLGNTTFMNTLILFSTFLLLHTAARFLQTIAPAT